MSFFSIAFRSIQQRGVASALTVFSMALGVMLVVGVLTVFGLVMQSFRNNASLGYNMIVGPKGGKEQLTLNTVYYLSAPVENVPYTYYLEFLKHGQRDELLANSFGAEAKTALLATAELQSGSGEGGLAGLALEQSLAGAGQIPVPDAAFAGAPSVELGRNGKYGQFTDLVIPLCLGDYYHRFRVVGTTPALFDDLVYDLENDRKFEFAQGRNLQTRSAENGYFEAVVGARVAREIRLTELELKAEGVVPEAAALVAEYLNWSKIEPQEDSLMVTLGQGTTESDLVQVLRRLDEDHAKGRRVLTERQQQALAALRAPDSILSRRSRKLELGDMLAPAHGEPGGHTHARKFALVGILRPSGTPNDRAVFVNMEGFYLMEDHAKPLDELKVGDEPAAGPVEMTEEEWNAQRMADMQKASAIERAVDPDPLPAEQREVTAILLKVSPMIAPGVENAINEGSQAQAVLPVQVITGLFEFIVNPIQWTLLGLTAMICIVSGISILVSIYNSMSERRHEIAVMRALGAGRWSVLWIILTEATLLSLSGGVLGWFMGHAGTWLANPWIEEYTGVSISFLAWEPAFRFLTWIGFSGAAAEAYTLPVESVLIPALVGLAILVGIWPAISAYRTDVARSLGK